MSRVDAAAAMDRLPWLHDEPTPLAGRRHAVGVAGPLLATALLAGGAAVWFGARSIEEQAPPAGTPHAATTVRLPAARPAAPAQPRARIAPQPEIEPIVAPPTPVIDTPPPVMRAPERIVEVPRPAIESAPAANEGPKPAPPEHLKPWPVRQIDGAAGRLVRVGAFSSVHQAKRGWWAIVKVNPALKRLPALVVPVQSLRNGRVYYRLQMGTTSQAHSAVLCQRMRMIAEPCIVIGQPR
jgi:hypothetical protein